MSAAATKDRMYLIDAHSLIFQVFHAIPPMSSPTGLPTNALFGFTKDLLYLRSLQPAYLVCTFDRSEPTFREKLYKEYKAHRAPMDEDLRSQIPHIYELVSALRIPALSVAGYEADDVIATVSRQASQRGIEVYVCTSDKDCRQLIDDHVYLYNLRKRQVFRREELLADWGISPEQVVDLQSLVGDAVDNVPGVAGVGIKTAAKLLQEFGTLEKLQKRVHENSKTSGIKGVGPKVWETLRSSDEIVARSRSLVKLETDVPLSADWDAWKLQEPDVTRFVELCREYGFRSFAEQIRAEGKPSSPAVVPPVEKAVTNRELKQGDLFAQQGTVDSELETPESNAEPPKAITPYTKFGDVKWKATYHLIDTADKFAKFLDQLRKQRRFAIDLETTGLSPFSAEIVGYSFCWQESEAYYLAVRGPADAALLDPLTTLQQLQTIFEDPNVAKVNQNIKFDLLVLKGLGVELAGVAGDSMVADYLLHAGERGHNLEDLARRYLNHQVIPITALIGKRGKNQLRMDQVSPARIAEYSGEDADVAWRLCERLEPEVTAGGLGKLYSELEIPLIDVLAELEFNGIRLDVPRLKRLSEEMDRQLTEMEKEIYTLAGRPFNIASLKQLRQVLFDEHKLPVQRKTGITGEASTDQETLERLAALGFELPRKIVAHRQISKLKGTYVDALPELVHPRTGRIHASFNQTVAATGRLSSSDPNLQNIPIRSEQGGQIRQAFIPQEGWKLLAADYSQIELRMLAHFSADEALRQAFAEDRDVHTLVAAQIFSIEEGKVDSAMRRVAKTVNFGVIYGMSSHGLAQRLGMPRDEAGKFIDAYFARYPRVLDYQTRLLKNAERDHYVSTILGRRREITGIRSNSTYQQRNQPEREAINMEIQGSAADLMKLAMLNLSRRLREQKRQTRLLLQIHDELVLEVPPEEFNEVVHLVREEMTTPLEKKLNLQVPLKVEVAAGMNWLDVEEVK